MKIPLITEIQRFSLQDGPGIRTTVFLKGCPLRCPWCHNPETQDPRQEFYYYQARCVSCGRCAAVCNTGASSLVMNRDGARVLQLDRTMCDRCMRCVAVCLADARAIVGQEMSIEDILREALSDQLFYKNSGGGVTISGGDPLLYPEFTVELAGRLKENGVHVAIETSCFPKQWRSVEPLLKVVDLFIVDLKCLDPLRHETVLGWPLKPILANLQRLLKAGASVRIHLPVIPGFNDSERDFEDYIAYLRTFADVLNGVDILNYHVYGEGKYAFLGRAESYRYKGVEENSLEKILPLAKGLKQAGIRSVTVGGLVGVGPEGATAIGDN